MNECCERYQIGSNLFSDACIIIYCAKYSLCDSANIDISYVDADTDFTIEFSRADRNNMSEDGMINGTITEMIRSFLVLIFLQ